jgi:hypothetical protein
LVKRNPSGVIELDLFVQQAKVLALNFLLLRLGRLDSCFSLGSGSFLGGGLFHNFLSGGFGDLSGCFGFSFFGGRGGLFSCGFLGRSSFFGDGFSGSSLFDDCFFSNFLDGFVFGFFSLSFFRVF